MQQFTAKQIFFGGLLIPVTLGLLTGGVVLAKNNISFGNKGPHFKGGKSAKVTLVEYSDFQCPYCERAYPVIKQLLQDYGNKIRVEYKHFPLSFHPHARPAAEASECAAEQGKFWEMHDKMFENQDNLSDTAYKQWAKELGLNTAKFSSCVDTHKYAAKVEADYQEGIKAGVQGTPATLVNGELVSGAQPYEVFKQVIDSKL